MTKSGVFSLSYPSEIVSKVLGKSYQLGKGKFFINELANPITDDHYYVNKYAHIKMIDIIHQDKKSTTGFPSFWHTHADNITNIDKLTLQAVGKTILAIIYEEKEITFFSEYLCVSICFVSFFNLKKQKEIF